MSDESNSALRQFLSEDMLDVLVRVGLIAIMAILCFRIFAPFMNLLLWGLILGVALYPLQQRVARSMGNRQGGSATLLVVVGLLLIGGPTILLGSAFASQIYEAYEAFGSNSVTIQAPNPSIAEWPFIGERLYEGWSAAAADLPAFLEKLQPQLGELTAKALSVAAGTMGGILLFLGALIIAGVMMAYGESGSASTERILSRFAGANNGPRLHSLVVATIRSVATGVIGVAFIQALLLGLGFFFADIPAAGLLAVAVMLIGIMQIPALLISLPAIGYLWWAGGDASMVSNIIWSIYLLIAGMADNVLKPLLLGRGVEAPMPIILIGALGGMVAAGIVGLFTGAVALAVGYQLFMDWVNQPSGEAATEASGTAQSGPEAEASSPTT